MGIFKNRDISWRVRVSDREELVARTGGMPQE